VRSLGRLEVGGKKDEGRERCGGEQKKKESTEGPERGKMMASGSSLWR
jgi:hypothetical protein